MIRAWTAVLVGMLAMVVSVAFPGCSGGGGGSGGIAGDEAMDVDTNGSEAAEEATGPEEEEGRPVPPDELAALAGCGADPTFAGGAYELPHYDLIPAPPVPRAIREAERPARVDLSEFVPTPCNQGYLHSCACWVGGYGLMTYLAAENIEGWVDLDRTDRHFSPTFIFNRANAFRLQRSPHDSCLSAGTFMPDMFTLLRDTGCATWLEMPYTADHCETQPDAETVARAGDFKIGYFRCVEDDVATMQSYLDRRIPVAAALILGPDATTLGLGDVYSSIEVDHEDRFVHSLLTVGYDNDIGALKIMNSWGTKWGAGGFGFVSYEVWEAIAVETYVVGRELVTPITTLRDIAEPKLLAAVPRIGARSCAGSPLLDSDGDGYPDTLELEFASFGLDPLVPDDNPDFEPVEDADADGWPDETELVFGTDPASADDFPFDCDFVYPEDFFDEFLNQDGDSAGGRFRIIGVDLPSEVTSGGERGPLTVFWEGDPVFPVTLIYRPVEGGCSVGSCLEIDGEFPEEANPLVFEGAVYCLGFAETVDLGYEVVLEDALGRATDPAEAGFTCVAP